MDQESDVLTVLFTDLVGSTSLLSALGDDAADELRRAHFSLLREAIASHRGREIKNLGDGLMVSFSSAREAVACGAAMQAAVSSRPDRLELRVGIDAGEPINENGDLFGTPVVVARRLCDAATGGQVLVSDLVRMLLGRRINVPLEALGELQLKGLEEPVVAHAVSWQTAAARVRLCGELAVEQDGERLDERLPSRQARALFALLVLERDRATGRDAIADALWPDVAPRSRDGSLRALLSGVRRVFGPDSIEGRENVRLVLPEGTSVDVEEASASLAAAEGSLERGDHQAAATAARRAAALTAQELLAGLNAPWIDERRAEQRELSLQALEIEARASLAAARPAEAERAARALVEAAPYRESAHALLMEALAASGNLAEATLAYDRLRTLLRDELGTTPAPALVALHDRLLAGGGTAQAAEPATQSALPGPLVRAAERPFVARAGEVERLRGAWASARGGEARMTLLAGEPGIGKTSLAARLAAEAHADGGTVLLGRCHSEALVPYEPFVEALRQLPDSALRPHATILARVMPELASEGVPDPGAEDHATRYLLFDAVARALESTARRQPLLLVFEDLHWAEPPTLLLLRHVIRAAEGMPLLIVATYRSTEAGGSEQVVSSIASLERDLPVERIPLSGLTDEEVAELIRALDGRPSSLPLGTAMRQDTAGNPLFVGQLLRHLDESGVLVERDGELTLRAEKRIGVPESARELVAARLAGLGPETVSALRVAAVIGRDFEPALVASVEERSGVAVLDVLEDAVSSGLVEETSDTRHAFVHALVQEAIYDGTGAGRRAATHAAVGEALEKRRGGRPAELAHHYLAAGNRDKGVEYSVATARRAIDRLAYEDAVAHYRTRSVRWATRMSRAGAALLLDLADAHARAGDTPSSKLVYGEAAALAEDKSLPEQLAEAAIGYGGRLIWEVSRDDPDVRALLERALERIGVADSPWRVRLLARIGGGPLRDDHDPTRRRAITGEALEMARRLDDPATLAYALDGFISRAPFTRQHGRQIELAERVDRGRAGGRRARACDRGLRAPRGGQARDGRRRGRGGGRGGDGPAGRRAAPTRPGLVRRRAPGGAGAARGPDRRRRSALRGGPAHRRRGDVLDGEGVPSAGARVIRHLQGRADEIEPALREAVDSYASTYPVCRCAHVHVLAVMGREAEARDALAEVAADGFGVLGFDETWLAATAFLAEAAYTLNEPDHARGAVRATQPVLRSPGRRARRRSVWAAFRVTGPGGGDLEPRRARNRAFRGGLRVRDTRRAPAWAAVTLAEHATLTGEQSSPRGRSRSAPSWAWRSWPSARPL